MHALPAQIQAARHYRQNARRVQLLGGKIGGVGNEDADGNLDRAVVDRALAQLHDEAEREANGDSTDAEVCKTQDAVEDGEGLIADDCRNTELQREKAGGIIHQALAFNDVDDPSRHAETAGDRRRGDCIGGRHGCSENNAGAPVEALEK